MINVKEINGEDPSSTSIVKDIDAFDLCFGENTSERDTVQERLAKLEASLTQVVEKLDGLTNMEANLTKVEAKLDALITGFQLSQQ